MSLITEEVEIEITNRNSTYFENLGYILPKHYDKHHKRYSVNKGIKIFVKTEDLSINSHEKVTYTCDNCGELRTTSYYKYCKYKKDDGKNYCQKCACKLFNSGENCILWNPNLTDKEREEKRDYPEYNTFVKKVFARDNYTCQCCKRDGNIINLKLEAHHLDGYDWCKEKRTDETNGITLCEDCHKNFHSIYGYGNNTKEQFNEWIGSIIEELKKYNGSLPTARQIYCIEDDVIIDSVVKYIRKNNITTNTAMIYKCCNQKHGVAYGKHYLWYDEYLKMSNNEVNLVLLGGHFDKRVICINDMTIFKNIDSASNYYKLNYKHVNDCCHKRKDHVNVEKDRLYFRYLNDYMEENNIANISEINKCNFIFD